MKVITKLENIPEVGVTIGNFDGVHKGHQSFLRKIKQNCSAKGLKLCVVTFWPHPHQILFPQDQFLINTYLERRSLLEELGIDYLYEIEFTRDLSTLDPGSFLDQYLFGQESKNVKSFYAGYDFVFGAEKSGDQAFLSQYCYAQGIEYVLCEQFLFDQEKVSSSVVRKYIEGGDLGSAAALLGRNFFIAGTVIRGEGRGHKLGFPTINIKYSKQVIIPESGVYASKMTYDRKKYFAITNVGNNPTFGSGRKTTIETNVFDFKQEIYGGDVQIEFLEKVRAEQRFANAEMLQNQIQKDIQAVMRVHRS